MNDRSSWLLALASANLVVLLAGAWLVDRRLAASETRTLERIDALEKARPPSRPATPRGEEGDGSVREQVARISNDLFDYYSEIKSDLYEVRQTLTRVESRTKRIAGSIGKAGAPYGVWGLASAGDTLPPETIETYRKDAEAMGVRVGDGVVEVRAFLNIAPDRAYPIEFFVTRWPESGHETMLHVVGNRDYDPAAGSEHMRGLLTALYKGLVAAGFEPGLPSAYMPGPDPQKPVWVPPKGEVVHLGVRYRLRGATHVARATDWVVDPEGPEGPTVLTPDAFRFTGGLRTEDPRTGDDMLSAELSGKAVSVYQDPNTLVEIGVAGNLRNDYQYHFQRIPRPGTIVVLGERQDGRRVFTRTDRATGTMTIDRVESGGREVSLATPPVLVVEPPEGQDADAPARERQELSFTRGEGGAWSLVHEELKNRHGFGGGHVTLRVVVDGKPLVSTGIEPLYLDLIFSKTAIVVEGDGAKPVDAIRFDAPPVRGTGAHGRDGPAPPPPPSDEPAPMDDR
jgi:hypothetical protein